MEDRTLQATLRTALIREDHTEAAASTGTAVASGPLNDDGMELDVGGLGLTFGEATCILFVCGITEGERVTLSGGDTRWA